jgi:hypothetical protein
VPGKSKLTAILCGLLGGLCAAGSNGPLARTEVESPAQGAPGNKQSSPAPGAVGLQTPAGDATPGYPQTTDGFNAQISAAVAAYQAGDGATGRRLLEQFRLPHSAEWFAEYIAPEQSEALNKRYDALFEGYVNLTENRLQELARSKGRKLASSNLKPMSQEPPHVTTISGDPVRKLSGIVPAKQPVCFNVNFAIQLTGKSDLLLKGEFRSTMWEDTYTYQDGAFRFVGHGASPFWVWEERPNEKPPAGPYVATPLDFGAGTVDEVIPFAMDKVVAALESAMESEDCKVVHESADRIECKRTRGYSYSAQMGYGGESVTAILEAKGEQTHVHISTGKGFYGRLGKKNWSVPIYEDMVKGLKTAQQ